MNKDKGLGPLEDGGRVVIIGGGPGGTSTALRLHCLAAQMGYRLEITLVENKQFSGEYHYNQCAGVLAYPLPNILKDHLGVDFPFELNRGSIRGYVLHTDQERILLAGESEDSIALRRVQFDAYMLEQAQRREIRLVRARAIDLEFHPDLVIVYTENCSLEADVVVGAFGLDEGTGALFGRQTGYRPPQALSSVVTKYHPGPDGMAAFGPHIHAFLPHHPHIEFAGITPKGNHLTINIAGRRVDVNLMSEFLSSPHIKAVLPNLENAKRHNPLDLVFYKGRFPSSIAHRYYGDRYVLVGDAAGLVRSFKGKGVNTAIITGIRAAETIMTAGISRRVFHEVYRIQNQDITGDLPFGRYMRLLTIILARYQLIDPVIRAARYNEELRGALYDAVSAHGPYKGIVARAFRPRSILAVLRSMVTRHQVGS